MTTAYRYNNPVYDMETFFPSKKNPVQNIPTILTIILDQKYFMNINMEVSPFV